MKLTLWLAEQHDDSNCYNIIAKTKKACLERVYAREDRESFKEVFKVEIEYADGFDLFEMTTGEGGGRCAHAWTVVKRFYINHLSHVGAE